MSTDKFHISEMVTGHDARMDAMIRRGYGDLMNMHKSGRKEVTIDTASMYKKAADASTMLTGAGAVSGGLAGNLIADYAGSSSMGRLLLTVAGSIAGGVGGNMLGKRMDNTTDSNGISMTNRNRNNLNAALLGSLGSLAGYGTSKYVMGSDNKIHNAMGALAGGLVGAGVGSGIAYRKQDKNVDDDAAREADKIKLQGQDRDRFIRDYYAAVEAENNKGFFDGLQYTLLGDNPTEMDKVIAKYRGEDIPQEKLLSYNTIWKAPLAAEGTVAAATAVASPIRGLITGKRPGSIPKYVLSRINLHKRNIKGTARLGNALFRVAKALVTKRP